MNFRPCFPALVVAILLGGDLISHATIEPVIVWPIPPLPAGESVYTHPVPIVAWMEYFKSHFDKKAKAGPVEIIFDGDSITDRWESTGLKVWQAHFGRHHPFDAAIGGDGIQHALWRLDHGESDGLDPRLVVLMIGTNNLHNLPIPSPPAAVADGIKALVADYRHHFPKAHVLVLGIFPRGQSPTDPMRAEIKEVNRSIAALDDGKDVTVMDIGDKLLQPDGTISADLMPDFLHPTEKGYAIWADAIQPIVDKYCTTPGTVAPASATVMPSITVTWPVPSPPPGTDVALFPVPNADWIFHWLERYLSHVNQARSGSFDLILDGDKPMEGWNYVGKDAWKNHFASVKTLNLGEEGAIQNTTWRAQHGELDGQNPRLVALQPGYDNTNEDPAQLAQGFHLLVDEVARRCPNAHILLLGVLPRGAEAHSRDRELIDKLNKIVAGFADSKKITFMDSSSLFLNADGTLMTDDFQPNSIAPSAKGYEIWAKALAAAAAAYVPGAKP